MAAITMKSRSQSSVQYLEDVTITNQTANSTAVTRGLFVPDWAVKVCFYIFLDSQTGSSPLFDFVLGVPDFGTPGAVTDDTDSATLGDAAWNGITQVTGAGPYIIKVECGPDVTDDDTGSATASSNYGVKVELPPVITYTYTTDGTTDDEDYRFRIVAHFRR